MNVTSDVTSEKNLKLSVENNWPLSSFFFREKDLCKYLKPLDGTLPHRGGRKEYAPDGTWLQKKKLETLHIERKAALSEQKCPRM